MDKRSKKKRKAETISELKKHIEELKQAQDQEDEEMQGEEDWEEERDDEQRAEYEAQQAAWISQEDEKGTSSKVSSYTVVESTKISP